MGVFILSYIIFIFSSASALGLPDPGWSLLSQLRLRPRGLLLGEDDPGPGGQDGGQRRLRCGLRLHLRALPYASEELGHG